MPKTALDAVVVLGDSIRAGRLDRRWTVADLAERVGVSSRTLQKVEHGDPSVAIGTVFEAARIVGVDLYGDHLDLAGRVARVQLALLPRRARRRKAPSNDF